jgi:hypothetical protein
MSHSIFIFYYVAMALLVGICAIGRRPGFLVMFLLSLLVTPFVALLFLYIAHKWSAGRAAGPAR